MFYEIFAWRWNERVDRSCADSKLAVRTVAERHIAAVLAAAEEHPLVGVGGIFHRRNARSFVTAIAERLFAALAAGAPEVGFALFNFHGIGRLLGNDGRVHVRPLGYVMTHAG